MKIWVLPLLVVFAFLVACFGINWPSLVGAVLGYILGANAALDQVKKELDI